MATATVPSLRENKMGTMPVGKLLFNMALPLAISMLVQAFYNVVDSFYVSRISESAVTALSLAFPVQNLLIGCATGIGVGMNALLSRSLGEGNRDRANRAAGNGIFLSLCFALAFMIFGMTGRQCQTTIGNGKLLMLDRQLVDIDEEAVNARILEESKKLWGALNNCEY